jgi:methylase of polypeptide subunit release factors
MEKTPNVSDPAAIGAFREVLDRAPFSAEAIREALGTGDEVFSRHRDIPVHERRLRSRGSFGTLIRIFVLNLPVPEADAREALAPLPLEAAERMGVVRRADGTVRPLARLVPHDDLVIASDLRLQPGQRAPNDHVPGVHRPSVTLAHLTSRRPVERALDLGTGCGVEALLLARHAKRVVASDVSARAIAFARFNGLLNRAPTIDWRVGSWFEPIGDARFETIACNPPYVISPETRYVYRDSGMQGDSVSEQVVREVAAHLAEGGFGTVTVSWASSSRSSATPADGDAGPVRRWVARTGCDAWILHYRTEDPLTTAKSWNEQDATDPATYAATLDRWLAYYERLGIRAIAYGAVVLRRRVAPENWVKVDSMPAGRLRPASDHILRVFGAQDHLERVTKDAELFGERFRLVPRHSVTRRGAIGSTEERIELSLEEGLGFQATIDEHMLRLLTRLDGRTLGEALEAAARDGGLSDADAARYVAAGAPLARTLLASGLIEAAPDD